MQFCWYRTRVLNPILNNINFGLNDSINTFSQSCYHTNYFLSALKSRITNLPRQQKIDSQSVNQIYSFPPFHFSQKISHAYILKCIKANRVPCYLYCWEIGIYDKGRGWHFFILVLVVLDKLNYKTFYIGYKLIN